MGDGASQMLGINEHMTACRYYEQWHDPRLIVCVLNNGDLNQVTWEMRAFEGSPRYLASQELPDLQYAEYAEMIGLRGIKVEDPDEVGSAWDQLLAADRPAVMEVVCDPNVPNIPPQRDLRPAQELRRRRPQRRSGRGRNGDAVGPGVLGRIDHQVSP